MASYDHLKLNEDDTVAIRDSNGNTGTAAISSIVEKYEYSAHDLNLSPMNKNANAWLICKSSNRDQFNQVFGLTFPTDKTINIECGSNTDNYVLFYYDGNQSSDFGNNCWYYRGMRISGGVLQDFGGYATNCYGGVTSKTINSHVYYGQSWTKTDLAYLYTELPLTNFTVNGEPVVPPATIVSNGGGATHIAKVTGQLKDLSSNLSDILIVSGGGGGGMLIGDTIYPGADAGGIAGNSDNSADQSTGYAFGQGENG